MVCLSAVDLPKSEPGAVATGPIRTDDYRFVSGPVATARGSDLKDPKNRLSNKEVANDFFDV